MNNIGKAQVGDRIFTFDVTGKPIELLVERIENETEGGSTKWGKVYYNKENLFITEKTIRKINGIFKDSEPTERVGYIVRNHEKI